MKRAAILLLAALALGGCAKELSDIQRTVATVTTQVTNPIGRNQLAQAEATYQLIGGVILEYRKLGFCRRGQSASTLQCASRSVYLQLQKIDEQAYTALKAMRAFVRNNPTISAAGSLAAIQDALSQARGVIATGG